MGRKLSSRQGWLIGGVVTAVAAGAVTLAATGVATASPAAAPVTAAPSAKAALKYDAKTLFRGVFFGHGAAAAIVAPYVEVPAESAEGAATEDKIMAAVERRSPGTIQGFYDAVASGSHVATRQALLRSSAQVQAVVKSQYGVDITSEKSVNQGFVLAIPVAVAVVAVVWKYVKKYSYAPDSSSSGLQMDGLVHALVTQARR